jgi:hypothetical protein
MMHRFDHREDGWFDRAVVLLAKKTLQMYIPKNSGSDSECLGIVIDPR